MGQPQKQAHTATPGLEQSVLKAIDVYLGKLCFFCLFFTIFLSTNSVLEGNNCGYSLLVSQKLVTVEMCNRFVDKNHVLSLIFHNHTCPIPVKAAGDSSSL